MKIIWRCTANWSRKSDIEEEKHEIYFGPRLFWRQIFKCLAGQMKMTEGKRGRVPAL